MKFRFLPLFFLLVSLAVLAQTRPEYAVSLIPQNLKDNANAVVRLEKIEIEISSRANMSVHTYRAITVLNEFGLRHINAHETDNIRSIDATIYDASGAQIKNVKRKEFKESSLSEGYEISDGRVTALEYTPTTYPFTVLYESEVTSSTTAFIPQWFPLDDYFLSAEKSMLTLRCVTGLGLKYKDFNFGGLAIRKEEKDGSISFEAENLAAYKREQFSPALESFVPHVMFGLEKFSLEGVEGEAKTWENFSAWRYRDLLSGTDELSPETQGRIKMLTAGETSPMKKAKIVYKYVQDRTRYVSIQLGIGGWRPMKAKDVDRLGYGDCKALTNYTRALLSVVGVPSYYAVIYGDEDKRNMDPDFVSMQGNHIILALPEGDKINWLECTSQTLPFGYQGNFTDDRIALLVKPEGGALVHTNVYKNTDNHKFSKGAYAINEDGSLAGAVEIRSAGLRYEERLALEKRSADDLAAFYKEYFSINNFTLKDARIANDKDRVEFTETLSVAADGYAGNDTKRLIFGVNAFTKNNAVPQRYRARTNPFEVSRGFSDEDEIIISFPVGYEVEAKPENLKISDVYGEYSAEYTMIDGNHMLYRRKFTTHEGSFPASDYEKYRKFRETIARSDNAKCVLVKSKL
jgi:transglutaminase-like putative cysteine protease